MATVMTPVVAPGMGAIVTPVVPPIVIDLGKEKKKRIKALKRGRGKLVDEVAARINAFLMEHNIEADGKQLVPVILIYKQKRKRKKKAGNLLFPFFS